MLKENDIPKIWRETGKKPTVSSELWANVPIVFSYPRYIQSNSHEYAILGLKRGYGHVSSCMFDLSGQVFPHLSPKNGVSGKTVNYFLIQGKNLADSVNYFYSLHGACPRPGLPPSHGIITGDLKLHFKEQLGW